jgi:hypothetical protein
VRRCIFCCLEKADDLFSLEHVFPEAIGGRLTIRDVCKQCNDRLGHSVDTTLTHHKLIEFARMSLGLAGKTGQVPNPIERGTLREDEQHKLVYKLDPHGSNHELSTVPRIARTTADGGEQVLTITLDAKEEHKLADIVNKARRRRGLEPLSSDEVAAIPRVRDAIENPCMNIKLNVDICHFRRGLMKIVYELACLWLGPNYVDDEAAPVLRGFIWDKELQLNCAAQYPIRGTMQLTGEEPLLPFWPNRTELLAASLTVDDTIAIYVRVLGVFEAMVRVAADPSRYPAYEDRFLCTDPKSGTTVETPLMDVN